MRRSSVFASLFFFLSLPAYHSFAKEDQPIPSRADSFIAQAVEKSLHRSRPWRALLHYKPALNGSESLIDDLLFFMAPDGKSNPRGELEATIRGFFTTDLEGEDHPQCRFPARFHWLDRELSLKSAVPKAQCLKLEKALKDIDPSSVSMIFASAHINSPASMFGHPLLRIDSQKKSALLAQAVNYSAQTPEKRGVLFAFYGIFGYYNGLYSILPYYEKVAEYNDFDMRSLWEYQLDINAQESRMMIRHLWELTDKFSYYYFFDENCAYIVLFLLEAVRPSLDLTSGWNNYVIPVDTFRRVLDAGIVTGVTYRPSKMAKMMAIANSMSGKAIQTSRDIATGKSEPGESIQALENDDSRKRALDLAAELLQRRYAEKKIEKKDYQRTFLATLRQRGALGGDPPPISPITTPVRPDQGHLSGSFNLGYESNDGPKGNRVTFSMRPALHDIMDPQDGYVEGSQIEFFSLSFSFQPLESKLWFERADLVSIVSLTPVNNLFFPMSWRVNFGLNRREFANENVSEAFFLNAGGGYTAKVGNMGLVYGLLEADAQANHNFDKGYAIGPGISLGLILDPVPGWKTGIKARATRFVLGHDDTEYEVIFSQRYTAHRNMGIHLDLKGKRIGERDIKSALLKLVLFM
ncbi:MAG: DUF4105 domain-containing protein [Nitrospinota bacterium]|nr:DUF4105 domain-containing protein [Nitrospinota bacterium]